MGDIWEHSGNCLGKTWEYNVAYLVRIGLIFVIFGRYLGTFWELFGKDLGIDGNGEKCMESGIPNLGIEDFWEIFGKIRDEIEKMSVVLV